MLYPGVFPNLAALNDARSRGPTWSRSCSPACPSGIIPGFQNFTGPDPGRHAAAERGDPAGGDPNILGILGGDLAGFPNGRRVPDDIVDHRAAGHRRRDVSTRRPGFTADGAAALLTDGSTAERVTFIRHVPVPRPSEERVRDRPAERRRAVSVIHEHAHHHPHGHDRPHDHEHHLAGAGTSERAFGGPVVVDVGPGVGALVVYLGRDWLDDELHLRSLDRADWSTHTGVWERNLVGARRLVAAVFPSLPHGRYGILDRDGHTAVRVVDVEEARVREVDLC